MAWSRPLRQLALIAFMTLAPAFMTDSGASAQSYAAGLDAYDRGNYEEALRILRPLAEEGDARAQYGLGKIYETGGGPITPDAKQAVYWYSRSAEQGIAAAQNNLALMYAEGRGVAQNKPQALALWEAAARGGHPHAQYNMGLLFYRGEGVERDLSAAANWFGLAAENGLAEAQFAVAEMHRLGVGLPQDNRKALSWYQMAGAQGHEAARNQGDRLRGEGTSPAEVRGSFSMPEGEAPPVQLADNGVPQAPQASAPQTQPEPAPPSAEQQEQAAAQLPPEPEPRPEQAEESEAAAAAATEETEAPAASAPQSAETELPSQQLAANSAAAPPSGGAYSLWLGSLGEEAAARQMSANVGQQYGETLGGAELSVRRVEVGATDVFYRVVASSWPSVADARSVCTALRRSDPAAFCKVLQD